MYEQEELNAFVMIKVEPGNEVNVFNAIRDIKDQYPIKSVSMVYGEFDIILRIQGVSDDIQKFVVKLRTIPGVVDTRTFLVARFMLL